MKTTICVDDVLNRLKKLVGVYSDVELARSLGLTASNVSSWRRRKSLPYKKCIQIAVEHGTSLDWLLFGQEGPASNEAGLVSLPSQHMTDQALARGQSSGFSNLREDEKYPSISRKTSDEDVTRLDPLSVLQDSEKGASTQKHALVLVAGSHRASADLLRSSLRELLLMFHDAGTIDLLGTDAEAIADAFMGTLSRSMRETANTRVTTPNSTP